MTFRRLSSIVLLALASAKLATCATTTTNSHYKCPNGRTTSNKACCALFPVVDFMQKELFENGICGEDSHSALRLAFHDAIGYSVYGDKGGGADGSSFVFNTTENEYPANLGLDDITATQIPLWKQTNLSAGDFIHLAAAVGTANCPGAPRLQFLYGRPPPRAAAPPNTVPEPTDTVTEILDRFDDAGFSPLEVIALLASHTIAAADVIDPSVPGSPFDSTPGTFDSQFYLEVLLPGSSLPGNDSHLGEVLAPLKGEMRLQSDYRLARHPRTACFWQAFVNQQTLMMNLFYAAMAKLQVLGQDTRKMVDCSDVVPVPKTYKGPIKYPATFSKKDVDLSCPGFPFPNLQTQPGRYPPTVPLVTN